MNMENSNNLELDISEILSKKKSAIFEDWLIQVHQDKEIPISENVTKIELNDDVASLLDSIIEAVRKRDQKVIQETLYFSSLSHTKQRLTLEYNVVEIAHEYTILKQCVYAAIEPDLNKLSGNNIQMTLRQIDAIFDDVICNSFDYFYEQRTQDLRETERQLKGTNIELNRLIKLNRDNFTYLAHDFKTPLNSIMGYAQILLHRQDKLQTEESNQNIEHINRMLSSSRLLVQMVNDLLEVFRYDKIVINLKISSFDIRSIINSIVETVQPLAEQKGIKIIKEYEDAPHEVVSDITQMQKVISNLLSNAIRYTQKGEIILRVKTLPDDKWLLAVEDTGIGISEEDQEKIFQPFFRVSNDEYKPGSTGLGLAIVKESVELLQGELKLVSELNKGSSFVLTFPLQVVC